LPLIATECHHPSGEPAEHGSLLILLHGRVDLTDRHGRVGQTIDAAMTPPLGSPPLADAPPQRFTAVAVDTCLLLVGGTAATDALLRILAPGEHSADDDAAADGAAAKPAINLMQALELMKAQQAAATKAEATS